MIIQIIKEKFFENKYFDGEIIKIDGIAVEYPDWWFNVRGSNTDPVILLNLESKSAELTKEKVREISELLRFSH